MSNSPAPDTANWQPKNPRKWFTSRLEKMLLKKHALQSLGCMIICMLVGLSGLTQCPDGDVTLTNQDEVNQFLIDYPNCTEITGDLRLNSSSSPEITDLNALVNISSVLGALRLENLGFYDEDQDVFVGPSLEPLGNIIHVGDLYIGGNEMIFTPPFHYNDLSPLNNIAGEVGDFWITKAFVLAPLPDFPSIETIDYFRMAGVSNVASNPSFPGLTNVRDFTINQATPPTQDILSTIVLPANLESVSAQLNPDTEFAGMYISNLPALEEIIGGESLSSIDGDFILFQVPALTDMSGFNAVTFAKYMELNICQQAPFDAFPNLLEAESIFLKLQVAFDPCEPLSDPAVLVSIGADATELNVTGPSGLDVEFEGAEEITFTGNFGSLTNLRITAPAATSISGFASLSTIFGDLRFETPELLALPNFASLESVSTLRLISAPGIAWALSDLSGLENLSSLVNLTLFPAGPVMDHNLQSLNGLQGLTEITGEIRIRRLPNLSSVDALGDDLNFNGDLTLTELAMLENCPSSSTLCHLLSSAENVSLEENGSACNDLAEILDICSFSTNQAALESELEVDAFFDQQGQLMVNVSEAGSYTFTLYDQHGKRILEQSLRLEQAGNRIVLPHELRSGIYLARWFKNQQTGSLKILKTL